MISMRVMPAIAVTTPISQFSASSTGPCSICSSRKACDVRRASGEQPRGIAADLGDALRKRAARRCVRSASRPAACPAMPRLPMQETPKIDDFLGEEIDDLQIVVQSDVRSFKRPRDFERRDHAGDAVEPAAIGHGVGMRAEHDGAEAGFCAGAAADQVAGGIDAGLQPGRLEARSSQARPSRNIGVKARRV